MDEKFKKIQFLSNELDNIERDLQKSIDLIKSASASLKFWEPEIEEELEIQICKELKMPLSEFLQNYFEKQKQIIYIKMFNELNSNKFENLKMEEDLIKNASKHKQILIAYTKWLSTQEFDVYSTSLVDAFWGQFIITNYKGQ